MNRLTFHALYEPGREPPNAGIALARLEAWLEGTASVEGTDWPLTVRHPRAVVTLTPERPRRMEAFQYARSGLDRVEQSRVEHVTHGLRIRLELDDTGIPMGGLQRGFMLIRPLFDGLLALLDPGGSTAHAGSWPASVADAPVPPRPESLFAVHAVGDEPGPYWIHSHGLSRFGLPEVEVLQADAAHTHVLGQIVKTIGARLLLEGVPTAGRPLPLGPNIEAALVPFTEVAHLAGPGAARRDADHAPSNRVLVVPDGDGWASLATAASAWPAEPVLYRLMWETTRMEALAAARWPLFVQLFDVLGGLDDFRFIAKLGYGEGQVREHLWFTVDRAHAMGLEGTLLNEPHQDLGMHEGDSGAHGVDPLSDFRVFTPFARFDPETLPQLAVWVQGQLAATASA